MVHNVKKNGCRLKQHFLGVIFCGLLVTPVAGGEVQKIHLENIGSVEGLVLPTKFQKDYENRRDPFKPIIKKRRSISSSSRKLQLEALKNPTIPAIKNPNLKLLGIFHGPNGRQAAIQISSGERIVVRPGLELVHLGWTIKTISDREVLLEHLSNASSGKSPSQSRTFILSFPTPGKL